MNCSQNHSNDNSYRGNLIPVSLDCPEVIKIRERKVPEKERVEGG
jgi:hypothetical protein